MFEETNFTAEEIQRQYNATMDSVNLINRGKPAEMSNEEWADTVRRNVEHIKIMVAKDFWTEEQDLQAFHDVIDAHQ